MSKRKKIKAQMMRKIEKRRLPTESKAGNKCSNVGKDGIGRLETRDGTVQRPSEYADQSIKDKEQEEREPREE